MARSKLAGEDLNPAQSVLRYRECWHGMAGEAGEVRKFACPPLRGKRPAQGVRSRRPGQRLAHIYCRTGNGRLRNLGPRTTAFPARMPGKRRLLDLANRRDNTRGPASKPCEGCASCRRRTATAFPCRGADFGFLFSLPTRCRIVVPVEVNSTACHDILEFSARVLAILAVHPSVAESSDGRTGGFFGRFAHRDGLRRALWPRPPRFSRWPSSVEAHGNQFARAASS